MKLDPFYIFGLGVIIGTIGYVLYLGWKLYNYSKVAHKGKDLDAKYWYKAILNPNGPVRPTEDHVQKVKKQIIDDEGNKRRNPWISRVAAIAVIFSVILAVQLTGFYNFGGMFDEPPPTPKVYTVIFEVIRVDAVWIGLTACAENTTVTRVLGSYGDGSFSYIVFDTNETGRDGWYEFKITPSTACSDDGIWHILSATPLTGLPTTPPIDPPFNTTQMTNRART